MEKYRVTLVISTDADDDLIEIIDRGIDYAHEICAVAEYRWLVPDRFIDPEDN